MGRMCNCGECEYCLDWKERRKKYRRSEKNKICQKRYSRTEKGKKSSIKRRIKQTKTCPLEVYVRLKFNNAVQRGKIIRESCQVCGSFAHGHHPDYIKPFIVNWLCPQHHKSLHLNELGFEPPTKTYDIGA